MSQLTISRNQSNYAALKVEGAGVLTSIDAQPGMIVAAGQTVARMARLGEIDVQINVPENRLASVRLTQKVKVSFSALPGRVFAASVREVSPTADVVTRTYLVKVGLDHPEPDIRFGMTASVAFEGTEILLAVPTAALYRQGAAVAVWVVTKDQTVALRGVDVAGLASDTALVRSGVNVGEQVVTAGLYKLNEGDRVRVSTLVLP